MSLRWVHALFIVSAVALMAFVALWSGRQYLSGNDHLGSAVTASLLFVAGLAYLPWFLRHSKSLS